MIKKEKSGYKVLSEKGKNLGGPYRSKAAAQKRLRQVEYFKHKKGQSASGGRRRHGVRSRLGR
jgi:hypothetical protein